jgi:hypothetical protein
MVGSGGNLDLAWVAREFHATSDIDGIAP